MSRYSKTDGHTHRQTRAITKDPFGPKLLEIHLFDLQDQLAEGKI